jgi:hypothetical protein
VIVFSNKITPRLRYIVDFIGKEINGMPFEITTNVDTFHDYPGPKINYSASVISKSEYRIKNTELLFENSVRHQAIACFETSSRFPNGPIYKAFFKAEGDFAFDIFAASFYLLSRYEEYLPHQKDTYGRYAHENSLAFREGFLQLPLVNIWLEDFKWSLREKFPEFKARQSSFKLITTYDIDEAFSYKNKQWWRTMGGLLRSLLNGQWSMIGERIGVLRGKKQDPYDAFEWMNLVNNSNGIKPIYFFLVAGKTARYDKNILPSKRAMQKLIREHSDLYTIGIHPSWQSGDDPEKLRFEILKLAHLSGKQIHSSRQHYIRMTMPLTYRQLIELGIESEFSMGYGSINGFRASVALPFYWYDLEKEIQTKLLLYPFCFMDANSFYEQKFSGQQAIDEMKHYYDTVRAVNGTMITIWHNSFLGTGKMFAGWRDVFEKFVSG